MRLLFSSDIHGKVDAYKRFAEILSSPEYALGVLGGDLIDEYISKDEIEELYGATDDDLLDELPLANGDPMDAWRHSAEFKLQKQARLDRIAEAASIVQQPGKPILLVLGNHDLNAWPETNLITNMHLKRVRRCGWAFAGYRWTAMDRALEDRVQDVRRLRRLVRKRTILVTHSPPAGVLDGSERGSDGYGCEALADLRREPWLHLVGHVHGSAGRDGITINGGYPERRTFFAIDVESRVVEELQ